MQVIVSVQVLADDGSPACGATHTEMTVNLAEDPETNIDRAHAKMDELMVTVNTAMQEQLRDLRASAAAQDGGP